MSLALSLSVMALSAVGTGCATAQGAQKSAHNTTAKKKHTTSKKQATSPVASPGDDDDGTGDNNSGGGGDGADGEDLAAVSSAQGGASYYHDSLAGNLTANGEKYDPNDATCAHRSLPFGTLLIVEDVATGKKAKCRVNDRGPYADGRIVDVSKRVAKDLGMLDRGVIQVRIHVAKQPSAS